MSITIKGRYGRQDKIFRNYSEALRWLADNNSRHGQKVNVLHFFVGSWRRGKNEGDAPVLSLGGAYWFNRDLWTSEVTQEQFERLAILQRRYRSFHQYLTEVAPEWKTVKTIPYMDNSMEEVQRDKWGNERTVMTTVPHGDVC